jgi:hypothetical protein
MGGGLDVLGSQARRAWSETWSEGFQSLEDLLTEEL